VTQVWFSDPPECPDGEWCFMCLMVAKQRIIDAHPELPELPKDGKPHEQVWIPWDPRLVLRPARFVALSDLHNLGLVPVCWTHTAGFQYARPSRVQPAQVPPGLFRGGQN
jgi:hypothetical protein